jgi:deoxyinosine 3'endonuclease (endonuclease V)
MEEKFMLNYDHFTLDEATSLQNKSSYNLSRQTDMKDFLTVAGADISYDKDTDVIMQAL